MSFYYFETKFPLAASKLAIVLAIGFIAIACQRVQGQEQVKEETDADVLWQTQMHNSAQALHDKNFALAEQSCADALKTTSQFNPNDVRITTNLLFLGGIYQAENKTDLAEESYKSAIASREKAAGLESSDLVMPLEKLANLYYFIEHRYDLTAPVCLRIFQIVEKTSPADNPELIKRARAVAAVYRVEGKYAEAEPFYRQSLAEAGTNVNTVCDCLLTMVGFYREWGKYEQAESLGKQALALREKAAETDQGQDAQMNLAVCLYGLGEIYRSSHAIDRAEGFYGRSLEIAEKAVGRESSDLARPLSGLAATFVLEGKTNQAASLYQRAFSLTESNLPPGSPVVKDILNDYSALLERMNRAGEAKTLLDSYHWRELIFGSTRALRLNNIPEAEELAAKALDFANTFGAADPRLFKSQIQIADVYRHEGKVDLAEQTYKDAIKSSEKALGPKNPDLIPPLESMANFYYYTKVRYDQVASLYERILDILRAGPTPDPFEIARRERNLADVYQLLNQNKQAEYFYQQALATAESATNFSPGDKVQYIQALGDFYRIKGRCDQADVLLLRALAVRQQALLANPGPDAELDVAVCCDFLGQNYLAWNKPAEAEQFYRQSCAIVERIDGADSTDLMPRLMPLAAALRAQKKYQEAATQYDLALKITETRIGPDATEVASVMDQYADLLTDMNKPNDAKAMLDSANFIRKQSASDSN
jgi:tetratricopeptide (TPR) repeat protein